jgi:predicted RNA-binding protein YlxR (DUF448 family)
MAGRGAYLHNLRSCWQKALKGGLAQALKTELKEEDRKQLYRIYGHTGLTSNQVIEVSNDS